MGQENSTPIDESVPPERLESRTVQGIARYLGGNDGDESDVNGDGGGVSGGGKLGKKIIVLVI